MNIKRSLIGINLVVIVLFSLCVVVSTTSVSAATSSGLTNPQSQVSHAGNAAPFTGAPAVCAQDANNLDYFVRGTDGALYHRHWNASTGWSMLQNLGGTLTSDPAAVWTGYDLQVSVRGSNGALYMKVSGDKGSSWGSWINVGGQLLEGTGPATYIWPNEQIGWIVTGTNHQLYHKWDDEYGIHNWQSLGGYATSSPAAVSWANGRIDVFARGSNGALYQKFYQSGAWSGWASLGGQISLGSAPAVSSWGSGRLDLFVNGTNGALYHKSYSGDWSGWESLGGTLTSSPAAVAPQLTTVIVYVRGTNNGLWEKTYNGSWSSWKSLPVTLL